MSRRLVRVLITRQVMQNLNVVFSGNSFVVEGLPEDAALVGFSMNWERGCFEIIVKSKEFEVVEEGEAIPIRKVDIRVRSLQDLSASELDSSIISSVRASLRDYPHAGGDIEIMREVSKLIDSAFAEGFEEGHAWQANQHS